MMVTRYFVFCLFLLQSLCSWGQALSPRIASYDIAARLDVEAHEISATETLYWKNPSADTVKTLQFHLYYNAFKNNQSTFMQGRNFPSFLQNGDDDACHWAWIDIDEMTDTSGNDLTQNMRFIQPEDGNDADQTVLEVTLENPVSPYDSTTIDMKWRSKIPNIAPRTGYNKEFYFMVQWFPKVGVYEPAGMRYATEGQWNCHQYHASGEYYSDFGVYDVAITVPNNFEVGASGELVNVDTKGKEKTYRFKVEDVIDFGWTASPHFIVEKRKWKNTEISLLFYPGHDVCFVDRYFESLINALAFMDEHVGPYPYPTLTLVDVPIHGLFTGGMEYPTFISSTAFCFFPKGIRTPETLATHEFVHQYFMQMVATHEQEEPWMDEGFTTYFEGKILDHYLGEHTSTIDVLGFKTGNVEFNRWEYLASENPKIAESSRMARNYKHGGYGTIAYNKTAMWLQTLEGLIGEQTMTEIMKTYFNQWKFKHPCGDDFFAVVDTVVKKNHGNTFGENMSWFFDQVHFGSVMCDYAVASINNEIEQGRAGFFDSKTDCINEENNEEAVVSKVVLHRLEGMKLPVDVKVNFEDGSSVLEKWDGQDRSVEFNYQVKIISAEVDPMRKIMMDKNFINNSLTTEVDSMGIWYYVNRWLTTVQRAMQGIASLV